LANIDYAISSRHTLAGRVYYSDDPTELSFTDANVPGSGASKDFKNRVLTLKQTSLLSSSTVNEITAAVTRNYGRAASETAVTAAQIGMTPGADQPVMPLMIVQGLFQTGGNYNDDFLTAITSFQ